MKLLGGGRLFTVEREAESCAQKPPLYLPSTLGDKTTVDPDTSVDKMTSVFSMDELLSTQEVLVKTVGLVEGIIILLSCERFPRPPTPFLCTLT